MGIGSRGGAAASGPSKRIGEFTYAKSGKLLSDGFLTVAPGTISDGALTYPLWATMYPEFVSGSDIVFPANVEGIFLRNNGGLANTEGDFQDDATAVNGLSGTSIDVSRASTSSVNGSGNGQRNFGARTDTRNITLSSADNETRPKNRAFQLYTIVDTY